MNKNRTINHTLDLLLDASRRWGKGEVAYRPLQHTIDDVIRLEVDTWDDPDKDDVSHRYILEMKLTERPIT